MKIKTEFSAELCQKRYKKHFDRSIRYKPEQSSANYDFVNVSAWHTGNADRITQETSKKLQP